MILVIWCCVTTHYNRGLTGKLVSSIRDLINGSSTEAKIAFDKAVGIGMETEEFEEKVAKALKASTSCINSFNGEKI